MYFDALSFLEDEREAWRPFEALLDVPPDRFDEPVTAAHGWSARDLLSHLAAYQDHCLDVARELAVGEHSASLEAMNAAWETRGDAVNDDLAAAWRALPADEVRRRAREIPGELRGYLTVVPETRWVKHPLNGPHFEEELLDHYADHVDDLRAILAALG
jgi:Mycothiol maleylpyruvate isomerase N-terminal domain